jgi:hypothetical protein
VNYLFKSGFFALILLICAYAAAETKGWYTGCCHNREFRFTKFPGQLKHEELRLEMYSNMPLVAEPSTWWSTIDKIKGQRCSTADKCEDATRADIQIQHTSRRELQGRYIVEFNGKHFEDRFSIKIRRAKGPPCICE